MQLDFATELLEQLKEKGLHTAVDTSGAVPLEKARRVLDIADMILLDIKAYDSGLCRRITGKPGILENEMEYLEYCQSQGKKVWIRHVIVPGLTLDLNMLKNLGKYLSDFSCIERIEPLPFHKMGEYKWDKKLYRLYDTPAPTIDEMKKVSELLKSY